MLASLLYPYDKDVDEAKVDGWMAELEAEGSMIRYEDEEGHQIICSLNWGKHQKIDRPSKSKLPPPPAEKFRARSAKRRRSIAPPREHSSLDQGRDQRIKEGIKGSEDLDRTSPPVGGSHSKKSASKKTQIPDDCPNEFSKAEAVNHWKEKGAALALDAEVEKFRNHHLSHGSRMADWDAAWRTWFRKAVEFAPRGRPQPTKPNGHRTVAEQQAIQHRAHLRALKDHGTWMPLWGPRPGEPGCNIPVDILREFNLQPEEARS